MRYLFIIFLSCFCSRCTAQKIRFTDTTNEWVVFETNGSDIIRYNNDTIVNALHYRILQNNPYWAIREDSLSGGVYLKVIYTLSGDTNEYLLYNFHAQLGDTINFQYSNYIDSVIAVDSILINGIYHKTWKLQDAGEFTGYSHYYEVIEGIGSLNGPLNPIYALCLEGENRLTCFSQNGVYPPFSYFHRNCYEERTFVNAAACTDTIPYHVQALPTPGLEATVFPNPISASSVLQWAKPLNGVVTITDMTGRVVYRQEVASATSISLAFLAGQGGIYYYTVRSGSGDVAVGKIVVCW